jgi:hypothetical protein
LAASTIFWRLAASDVAGDLGAAEGGLGDVAAISLVVAVCSSTALAMVFWMSLIWAMMPC